MTTDGKASGDSTPGFEPDILVVDDTPANLDLLRRMLSKRGFFVRVATSGAAALTAVNAKLPDLIMLDVNMPGMSGYDVCRRLKADPVNRRVPVIFISALDDVVDKVRAFEAGGADYVTKPFELGEVLARIENQLKIARLQNDLERRNTELERANAELRDSQQRERGMVRTISDLLPGAVLDGRYRLEKNIGSGGFGTVFSATQIALDRPVAVKIFQTFGSASSEDLERFRREGVSACRVNHPNAVTIFDSGVSQEGIAYLVMELLSGRSMRQELEVVGRMPSRRVAGILGPVCRVLATAHEAGIVHRDIKPENIFIHEEAGKEIVKVFDFGVAQLVAESRHASRLTRADELVGTLAYIAPERLVDAQCDGRADVYSVGVTAYTALTNEYPYGQGITDVYRLAVRGKTTPLSLDGWNPPIEPRMKEAVNAALAIDPASRPGASELAEMFASVVEGAP